MRLEKPGGTPAPQALWMVLTPKEMVELARAFAFYFEDDTTDPGWHHHVGAGECELTITVDVPSADATMTTS